MRASTRSTRARALNKLSHTYVHYVVGLKYKKDAMNKIKRGYTNRGRRLLHLRCACAAFIIQEIR